MTQHVDATGRIEDGRVHIELQIEGLDAKITLDASQGDIDHDAVHDLIENSGYSFAEVMVALAAEAAKGES